MSDSAGGSGDPGWPQRKLPEWRAVLRKLVRKVGTGYEWEADTFQ